MTKINVDMSLAHRLIVAQFPQWKNLPINPVEKQGWDNRSFRLGNTMLVRLPSAERYAQKVEKEHYWLPRLAPHLPLAIPTPLKIGKPGDGYPWPWSIYTWIDGQIASRERIPDLNAFAQSLAKFLVALHAIDTSEGPLASPHNFFRGGPLSIYDTQTRQSIEILRDKIDVHRATEMWETALASHWDKPPVWVHGDIAPDNLLVKNGKLTAVIDFGGLAIGDPACDLVIAWTLLDGESRDIFRKTIALDNDTWARARGWALWKALIICAQLPGTNSKEIEKQKHVLNELLSERNQ